MRTVIAIETFDPRRGGAEREAFGLARELARRGHEVAVVAERADPEAASAAGVAALVPVPRRLLPRGVRAWRLARAARRVAREREAPALVAFARVPGATVTVPHGGLHLASLFGSASRRETAAGRALHLAVRLIAPRQAALLALERAALTAPATRFVAVSRRVRDDLVRLGGVAPERVALCPNGADVERFRPASPDGRRAARRALGEPEDGPLVLFASNHFALRGLGGALEAVARAAVRPRLVVAGRGRPGRFARAAARLGIADRVRFLGPVADLGSCLAAADLLLHPTFYDPCSLVTLEALAAGVPVVTTAANGAAELFAGDEGAVVEDARDAAALAAALDGLVRAPGARAAARATAERHPEAAAVARVADAVEAAACR